MTRSGHGNRGRRSKGARRLEIIGAVRTIARTADQIAARTVARLEFDVICTRGDRPDDNGEGAIAVNVGRDYSESDRGGRRGHTLPRERLAGAAVINRKLAEGRGKSAAEGHDSDLIKLAGRRAYQSKGHRQFVRRSIHRPTDLASRVVKRFTEVVPACGSLLYGCRCGSCHGGEKQCHDQQEYSSHKGVLLSRNTHL